MRKYLLLAALLVSVAAFGGKKQGQQLVDSLKQELTKAGTDTAKANLYIDLANAVHLSAPADGAGYARQSLKHAKDAGWAKGIARAHISLGVNLSQQSDLGNALVHYVEGMKAYEKLHNDKGVAQACWGIGNIYNVQKNFSKSLDYEFRALEVFKKIGDKSAMAAILGNIANNYLMMDSLDTALTYYKQGLAYATETNNLHGQVIDLVNISAVYFRKNDIVHALHSYTDVMERIDTTEDRILYGRTISNTGSCYIKMLVDTIATAPDSLIPANKTAALQKGIDLVEHGVRLSKETGDVEQLYNCHNDLYEAYKYAGDHKLALYNYELARIYHDSVFSDESNVKIAEVESKLKLDLKEKDVQIARLRSQVYIICIGILLFVVGIIIIKVIRQARSNKQLSTEKTKHVQHINAQNKILERIAHLQSHDLRGSVTNILGFLQLYNHANPADPGNQELINGITAAAQRLDNSITEVVKEENQLMKDIQKEAGK